MTRNHQSGRQTEAWNPPAWAASCVTEVRLCPRSACEFKDSRTKTGSLRWIIGPMRGNQQPFRADLSVRRLKDVFSGATRQKGNRNQFHRWALLKDNDDADAREEFWPFNERFPEARAKKTRFCLPSSQTCDSPRHISRLHKHRWTTFGHAYGEVTRAQSEGVMGCICHPRGM